MKKLLILTLAIFSINSIIAQEGITFITEGSWEEVLDKAKEEDKLIFLDAYTTWCGPCKKMDKEVFPLKSVATFFNENFVNVKMDMEKGEGIQIANRYNIRAYPALLLIDKDEKIVHRVAGFLDEEMLLDFGKIGLSPDETLGSMTARFENGDRDPAFLRQLAYAHLKAADRQHGKVAAAYLDTQKDWSTKENMKFLMDFTDRTESKAFDYIIENRIAFNEAFTPRAVTAKVESIIAGELDRLLSTKGDESIFEQANELFSKTHPGKEFAMTSSFKMTYYRNQGDRANFATAAIDYVDAMGNDITADELSDIAWTFYRVINDESQLKTALKWAKRSAKMEVSVASYDALASLYFKLGKKGKAKKYAVRAIEMAKLSNEDYSALEELLRQMK